MEHNDYPALYKASDSASISAQSSYLRLIKGHVFLLVVGAALVINPFPTKEYLLFNAFVFMCALGISIFLAIKKYEKTWYSARAVAESVKTATWRYMMKADPFLDASTVKEVNSVFRNLLTEILHSNNQLGESLGGEVSASEQLSVKMESMRASSLENRKNAYLEDRVDEQRKWYAKKSDCNKRDGKRFFILLVVLQVIAIGLVLTRIA